MKKISPKYVVSLIEEIKDCICKEFENDSLLEAYLRRWECNLTFFSMRETRGTEIVNVIKTLQNEDDEKIFKIAVDIGVNIPHFVASVPIITDILIEKPIYQKAHETFKEAQEKAMEEPANAIGLANSTLETIIKHILEDNNITVQYNKRDTLYKLTDKVLKAFDMFPSKDLQNHLTKATSGLLTFSQNIERIRSDCTKVHGKGKTQITINDEVLAYFVVNAVSTVGLFIISFYEKHYNNEDILVDEQIDEEIPILV